MLRGSLAIFTGLIAVFGVVAAVEAFGHLFYERPQDLDVNDLEQMRSYIQTLPPQAFGFVLGGWSLGTLLGGWLAALIARQRPGLYAGVIGGIVLAVTIVNLFAIPHPLWVTITALVAIPLMAVLAGRLVANRH